jgi:hypothetical protein
MGGNPLAARYLWYSGVPALGPQEGEIKETEDWEGLEDGRVCADETVL